LGMGSTTGDEKIPEENASSEAARTALVYSPRFLEHRTGLHCETPSRLKIVVQTLKSLGLVSPDRCRFVEPRVAAVEEIELVHDPDYVEEIRRFCASGGGHYDGDTVLSPESFDVACLAVGGMLKACDAVFTGSFVNAFALVRPPGHHAGIHGRALGATTNGFCLFNNVAVAASYMLKKKWVDRVLIFDVDGHHGNGTQEAFNNTSKVLYVSLHEGGIYPGTGYEDEVGVGEGAGYKVNVPLPPRSDDKVYSKALREVVLPVAEQFKPDFVLLSAGYDAHHSDNITSMLLSTAGYVEMFNSMLNLAERHCKSRLVACLEGGYSAKALSRALPATIAAMAGLQFDEADEKPSSPQAVVNRAEEVVKKVKANLAGYWRF